MNLSRIFILRPIATSLLMVALLIAGLLAYRLLPISALPEVDYPTIQVTTLYPGASPDVMTSNVTAPLERQFGQMPGLSQMSSTSSGGASVITLRFALDMSMDVAEQQVQAAINAGSNLLPNDLPMPPIYSKVNPADAPVLTLAITSPSLPVIRLNDLVENRLAPKLSQVNGVGLVAIAGGRRPAVRIQANPTALANLGLTLEDVRSSIAAANVKQAKGGFDGPARASTIDANDQLQSAQEYRELILAFKNGNPIRLRDVAQTVDDAENTRLAAWAGTPDTGSKSGVILNIRRQPGANVIDTVDRIKALLPQLQATLPASMDVQVLTDRTTTIRASVKDMQTELALAIGLVVAVIFVFLRSASATLIPSFAVPLSLVGTFGVMYLAGFSINNLTLMALTISTGFVVDDAIVMIENIARYVEEGEPPMQAALKGAKQIGFTIISLTISLIAVLIPLLFMGDVVGRLFHEFAITMAVAILLSAVVSLTLTPMLCARLLRHTPEESHGRLYQTTGRFFDRTIARYGRALHWVLNRRGLTWLAFGSTLVLTVVLYLVVPKGFFPVQDTGTLQATTEADQSISFAAMAERQQRLAERILQDPAVKSVSSFIGVDGANTTLNTGRLLIDLKPHNQRDRAPVVLRRLADETRDIVGIRLYAQPVQDLTIEDRVARTQYQLLLSSPDMAQLQTSTADLVQRMRALPQLADVASDLQNQGLQAFVQIDRAQASRLGVTVAGIDTALYNAFGQRLISTIFTQSNQYRVVLEVAPQFKLGPEALNSIYVTSSAGKPVALSSVARIEERPMPLAVNHVGQLPAATISFNTAPGVALGDAVKAIQTEQAAAREAGQLPLSVDTNFQGAALAFQASLSNTLLLILAAVVTMYIVLGVLYESTIHPVTILSTLPSAGVGALLALWMAGLGVDIVAVIGIVLLIGIVKKNAIMMIDFALEAQRDQGLPAREAIYQACLLRFRPILMTTLAALLGALPLMLGGGVGSELRHPLGVTMVGGLIVSQLLTLFTTPVIYLTFEGWAQRWRARRGGCVMGAPVLVAGCALLVSAGGRFGFMPLQWAGAGISPRRARYFSLLRQRKVPKRKATPLSASLRFASGNLRCSRPAGSRSNSLRCASLRQSRALIRWPLRSSAHTEGMGEPNSRTATRAIASLGPSSSVQVPRAGRSLFGVERSDDPNGCLAVHPLLAAPAAGRLWGGMGARAPMLRDLTRRGCPSGAAQQQSEFHGAPRNRPGAGLPLRTAKGSQTWGRLSFGYFSLARQRKVPRPPGRTPGSRPWQRHAAKRMATNQDTIKLVAASAYLVSARARKHIKPQRPVP